jgi:hypothetical protein
MSRLQDGFGLLNIFLTFNHGKRYFFDMCYSLIPDINSIHQARLNESTSEVQMTITSEI